MSETLLRLFRKPSAYHWLFAITILIILYLPGFGWDLFIDDHIMRTAVQEETTLMNHGPFFLYSFATGDTQALQKQVDAGDYLPWWSPNNLIFNFFRPFSSFTIWIDYKLGFPNWLSTLHSFLWYGFTLFALFKLYQLVFRNDDYKDLSAAGLTLLAWFLFAIDDAHSIPVNWISHRYTMISLGFGIWMLWAHEKHMRNTGSAYPGPLFYILGLLSGESVLTTLGYLFFRSLKNLKSLIPYAVITIVYLIFYKLNHFGSLGSGSYINPMNDPLSFLQYAVWRWPALMGSQLGFITTDIWLSIPVDSMARPIIALLGLGLAALTYFLVKPLRDEEKWLFWGAALSLLPVCAMFPHDRLLMAAGIGMFPVIARYLFAGRRRVFWWFLTVVHLFLAMIFLPLKTSFIGSQIELASRSVREMPVPNENQKATVILNAPSYSLGVNLNTVARTEKWAGRDRWIFIASMARSDHEVTRMDDHTIELQADFLNFQMERSFRSADIPFAVGDVVDLSRVHIRIMEVNREGRPVRVRYTFTDPLDEILFLQWRTDHFDPFEIPQKDVKAVLPGEEQYPYV